MSGDEALQKSFEAALEQLQAAIAGYLRPRAEEGHRCAAKCLGDKSLSHVAAMEGAMKCMAEAEKAEEKPSRVMEAFQEGVHRCRNAASSEFEKKFAGKHPDHSEQMAFMESVFKPCITKHLDTVPSLIRQLK